MCRVLVGVLVRAQAGQARAIRVCISPRLAARRPALAGECFAKLASLLCSLVECFVFGSRFPVFRSCNSSSLHDLCYSIMISFAQILFQSHERTTRLTSTHRRTQPQPPPLCAPALLCSPPLCAPPRVHSPPGRAALQAPMFSLLALAVAAVARPKIGDRHRFTNVVSSADNMGEVPASEIKWVVDNGPPALRPYTPRPRTRRWILLATGGSYTQQQVPSTVPRPSPLCARVASLTTRRQRASWCICTAWWMSPPSVPTVRT